MRKKLILLLTLVLLVVAGFLSVHYYSYIFAKTVEGEVMRIERVNTAETVIASRNAPGQFFSFSIAIRDAKGEIHTAITEDRQWAIVTPGQCAKARFFRYPPWEIVKGGTFFGARLDRLYDCKQPS